MSTVSGHRWRQYGPDSVACRDCGAEPWERATICPGPHIALRIDRTHLTGSRRARGPGR